MHKRMGEAVARVARKVNDTVENKTDSLGKPGTPSRLPLGARTRIRYPGAGLYFSLPRSKKSCRHSLPAALEKGKAPPKGPQAPQI